MLHAPAPKKDSMLPVQGARVLSLVGGTRISQAAQWGQNKEKQNKKTKHKNTEAIGEEIDTFD